MKPLLIQKKVALNLLLFLQPLIFPYLFQLVIFPLIFLFRAIVDSSAPELIVMIAKTLFILLSIPTMSHIFYPVYFFILLLVIWPINREMNRYDRFPRLVLALPVIAVATILLATYALSEDMSEAMPILFFSFCTIYVGYLNVGLAYFLWKRGLEKGWIISEKTL